jgi:hypothetical protein
MPANVAVNLVGDLEHELRHRLALERLFAASELGERHNLPYFSNGYRP